MNLVETENCHPSELNKETEQAKTDRNSSLTTLQGISSMIQTVMNLPSKSAMVSTLEGILAMTQGVLNIGVRVPQQVAGSKRVKKEESDDEGSGEVFRSASRQPPISI